MCLFDFDPNVVDSSTQILVDERELGVSRIHVSVPQDEHTILMHGRVVIIRSHERVSYFYCTVLWTSGAHKLSRTWLRLESTLSINFCLRRSISYSPGRPGLACGNIYGVKVVQNKHCVNTRCAQLAAHILAHESIDYPFPSFTPCDGFGSINASAVPLTQEGTFQTWRMHSGASILYLICF